jgi:rhodanese-related sulfurtransferase
MHNDRSLSGIRIAIFLSMLLPMIIMIIMINLIAGCGAPKTSDRDLNFVGASDARDIVGTRRNLLGQTSTGVWVDVRSPDDFAKEHIPGAINLPFQNVADDHKQLDPYASLVIYGDAYNDVKSQAMAKRLIELGHANVHTLRGGLKAWKDAGFDVSTLE